ncbi:MAG TPA: alpha/beta fold hydrolase [Kiritimatiellia bacterium]|nr:alpha/beta fold hydrolase [Kiritimatiellia bacterium]HNR93083.1 alpha/beta fold hydrolase [Kiritimatiellia bacterium]HNS82044.1 alpha/beta fold hydrolase [Kiritimatiellia bacterium]HQQ05217.1 alpha/beta fold hydrolase [Kiritimatiellia bacterium]
MKQPIKTAARRIRLRCALTGIAVALAGLVVFANILAWRHARALMHYSDFTGIKPRLESVESEDKLAILFDGIEIPRPESDDTPDELAPDCVKILIEEPDGITLGAWYCNRGTSSPLVILFHGYTEDKTALIPEARIYLKLGASVLLVDFRGSGESSEDYTTIGFKEGDDVTAAVNYARQSLQHTKIILSGYSMGAAAILRAVAANGISPDGIVAEAVFDTMLNTVRNRFHMLNAPAFPGAELLVFWGGVQVGFDGFEHNPVEYAAAVQCPILFMHGTDDPRALLSEGQNVYDAVPSQKMFRVFPNVAHQSYVEADPAAWEQAVKDLLLAADAITQEP